MNASPPCGGKPSHATKARALKALTRRRGRIATKGKGSAFGAAHNPIVPYLCPDCGAWHLGHAPIIPLHKRSYTKAR